MGLTIQLTLEQLRFELLGLVCGCFSIVNTTVVHSPWLVESAKVEEQRVWRAISYTQINPRAVQGSTLFSFLIKLFEITVRVFYKLEIVI